MLFRSASGNTGRVRGYHEASYGEGFADVYDDWYAGVSDVAATTAGLAALAGAGPVLELGVGTGRLAVPLAATGLHVHGVDTSQAMLERLTARLDAMSPRPEVTGVLGDMVDGLPPGPFTLVFVAYNTFFSLLTEERQRACFAAVERVLAPGGAFVVEAFVPDPFQEPDRNVTVRSVAVDRVVLSVSVSDPSSQRAEGQYVDITEATGVRLRPWSIRWATPTQLDVMAEAADMRLEVRTEDFAGSAFGPDSVRHVSIYRHRSV